MVIFILLYKFTKNIQIVYLQQVSVIVCKLYFLKADFLKITLHQKVSGHKASLVAHLPTMWETQVRSLGWEDPLEKEMAPHSSTLAWKLLWTEEPGRLQSIGVPKSWTRLSDFTSLHLVINHMGSTYHKDVLRM